MKVLIIGGTGVISNAVVKEAVKQGIDVTCINRGKTKSQQLPHKVNVVILDYRNASKMQSFLADKFYDAIIDVLCYNEKDT